MSNDYELYVCKLLVNLRLLIPNWDNTRTWYITTNNHVNCKIFLTFLYHKIIKKNKKPQYNKEVYIFSKNPISIFYHNFNEFFVVV